METLNEIFASMPEEQSSETFTPSTDRYRTYAYHDDTIIYINDKMIDDMSSQIVIKGEAYSQYVQFERDRFEDGIDLTGKTLQIHYERPDGEGDNCAPVNVEYSDTRIRYGWVIPQHALELDGELKVMPFAYGTAPMGKMYILKELYSVLAVQEGLAIDGGIAEPNESWYQQFLEQMDEYLSQTKVYRDESVTAANTVSQYESKAIAAIQNKGEEVLASIPEDYTQINNSVKGIQLLMEGYGYYNKVKHVEYASDQTYGYIYSSKSFDFVKGTKIKILSLLPGMNVFYRVNNTNYPVKDDFIFTDNLTKGVQLRIYYSDLSIDLNEYLEIYPPVFNDFGKVMYGSVPDGLLGNIILGSLAGDIYSVDTRRVLFDSKYIGGDMIICDASYEFLVYLYEDPSYIKDTSNWVQSYEFISDVTALIILRRKDNINENISSKNLENVLFINSKSYQYLQDNMDDLYMSGNMDLVNYVTYEDTVYENTDSNGCQGVASDGVYLYAFNGNFNLYKIRISDGNLIGTYNVADSDHANGATYNPNDQHIYVASGVKLIEYTTDIEYVNTHDLLDENEIPIQTLNGVSYSLIDDFFYVFSKLMNTVYVYDSSFKYIKSILLKKPIDSSYTGQGFCIDDFYMYVPLYSSNPNMNQMWVYDMNGNYVGRRLCQNILLELEDLSYDLITGKYYGSYQFHNNDIWGMRIVEFQMETDWKPLEEIIDRKDEKCVFSVYTDKPLFKLSKNRMFFRGKISISTPCNAFRITNSLSPKEKMSMKNRVLTSDGITIGEMIVANTTVFTNPTIPVYLNTVGVYSLNSATDMYSPLIVE